MVQLFPTTNGTKECGGLLGSKESFIRSLRDFV